jgi:fucose permease
VNVSRSGSKRLVAPLAALAFVSLGLPDGLLGVAWPSMRTFFGVALQELGVLLVATTAGYVVSSFSSGRLLRRVNLGTVLAASCLLTASGLLGYAVTSHWPVVLAFGVVLGLGAGAIDAALNTYVATHYGARMLNWLHACFGLGAASGPLIMTAVLQRGSTWQRGYVIVGVAQIALATCFAVTFRSWPRSDGLAPSTGHRKAATMGATLQVPAAWLGMAVFIAYAGVEASIGAWTYTLLTEGRKVGTVEAGILASLYWGGITGGRLLAVAVGGMMSARTLLRIALWSVALGVTLIWADVGAGVTATGLVVAGVACGPVFPSLIATTPERVGLFHSANAVGFQIAASAAGISVVPALVGVAAAKFGVETIARLLVVLAVVLLAMYEVLDKTPLLESPGMTTESGT